MKKPKPDSSANTSEQILDLAERLIQTRGYSTFSYQDIADALGIRKASIHYHFPSKTDLGLAVVERYSKRFGTALTAIAADDKNSSMKMLDYYIEAYTQFANTPDTVCLCGALSGEMMVLPAEMRAGVDQFFKTHQAWLAGILKRGVQRDEFHLSAPPAKMARMMFSALQGALLVKRTTEDASQLRDTVAVLKTQLSGPHPK
jgi:TetR/AcrR family transcriptional repressor of nem operon